MVALGVASSLFACSMLESRHAPGTRIAPHAARFAVLLPNLLVPAPPELSGATELVLGQVTRYLGAQGRERRVIDPLEARKLWLASVAEANESDRVSHDFDGAMRVFARKLGGPAAFDALVVSSLVYRQGRLRDGMVKWDGVVRRLPAPEEEAEPVPRSFDAMIPAVSLHVMVFAANGEPLFENYGGIDLAHSFAFSGDEGGLRVALRDPVLEERRLLREGIEIAFDPYLPRGVAGAW